MKNYTITVTASSGTVDTSRPYTWEFSDVDQRDAEIHHKFWASQQLTTHDKLIPALHGDSAFLIKQYH